MQFLHESLVELITQTSTNLPPDVRQAMGIAIAGETPGTQSSQALNIIASNIDMAAEDEGPICQDTGMPTFVVHTPVGVNQIALKKAIREAVAEATRRGKLRPNSVDSLTGKNSGDNLGVETPVIHFEQWEQDEIEVKLILKGGGCENKNIQYSLPCELDHLGRADRNLEGVRKCILHAVWQAQGQGCAPGAVGVCIGSDRAHGYVLAKQQLFRTLDDVNPDPELAQARSRNHGGSQSPRRRRDGLRRQGLADRMQDRAPPTGCPRASSSRSPTNAGPSAGWASGSMPSSGAITAWLYRDPVAAGREDGAGRRLPAHRPRNRSARRRSPKRRCPRAEGGRRGV